MQVKTDADLVSLYSLQYACVCLLLLANTVSADARPKLYHATYAALQRPTPQLSASFPSKMIFTWATPMLWRGWRTPIEKKVSRKFK